MVTSETLREGNRRLNELEFRERKLILSSYPRHLRFIVTNACNINCIMCRPMDTPTEFTLPEKWLDRELDRFLPYSESVFWQGGETFMAPYFRRILEKTAAFRTWNRHCRRTVCSSATTGRIF